MFETTITNFVAVEEPKLKRLEALWQGLSKALHPFVINLDTFSKVEGEFSQGLLVSETLKEFLEMLQVEVLILVENEVEILNMIVLTKNFSKSVKGLAVAFLLAVEVDSLHVFSVLMV